MVAGPAQKPLPIKARTALQTTTAAVLKSTSVPMMEASTRTEELRGWPCSVRYSRRKKLKVDEPKPT